MELSADTERLPPGRDEHDPREHEVRRQGVVVAERAEDLVDVELSADETDNPPMTI